MNSSTLTLETAKHRSLSTAKFGRKLLFRQLKQLHTGTILLKEGNQQFLFGEALSPDGAMVAEMIIHDPSCYSDIVTGGSIGAAEAYMTGDWSSPDLTTLMRVMLKNMDVLEQLEGGVAALSKPFLKWFHWLNQNTEKGSRRNIAAHYDLGNDFFKLFLDPTMMYSSGIFPSKAASMEQASLYKLQRICEKLQLKATDHILEIGTGWGGFAIYAAQHIGCRVTTTTISEQQFQLAKQRVEQAGLSDKITLLREDYRHLHGQYDKLVSIEMIEAVGWQYYETFFSYCSALLKANGRMLIQAITIEDQRFERAKRDVDFIQKYIFPGSCIPSINALSTASMCTTDLRLVQLEDFAGHYARTLSAWSAAMQSHIEKVRAQGFSEDFIRMWLFYFSYCEAGFAERKIGVAHLLFEKPDCRDELLP